MSFSLKRTTTSDVRSVKTLSAVERKMSVIVGFGLEKVVKEDAAYGHLLDIKNRGFTENDTLKVPDLVARLLDLEHPFNGFSANPGERFQGVLKVLREFVDSLLYEDPLKKSILKSIQSYFMKEGSGSEYQSVLYSSDTAKGGFLNLLGQDIASKTKSKMSVHIMAAILKKPGPFPKGQTLSNFEKHQKMLLKEVYTPEFLEKHQYATEMRTRCEALRFVDAATQKTEKENMVESFLQKIKKSGSVGTSFNMDTDSVLFQGGMYGKRSHAYSAAFMVVEGEIYLKLNNFGVGVRALSVDNTEGQIFPELVKVKDDTQLEAILTAFVNSLVDFDADLENHTKKLQTVMTSQTQVTAENSEASFSGVFLKSNGAHKMRGAQCVIKSSKHSDKDRFMMGMKSSLNDVEGIQDKDIEESVSVLFKLFKMYRDLQLFSSGQDYLDSEEMKSSSIKKDFQARLLRELASLESNPLFLKLKKGHVSPHGLSPVVTQLFANYEWIPTAMTAVHEFSETRS